MAEYFCSRLSCGDRFFSGGQNLHSVKYRILRVHDVLMAGVCQAFILALTILRYHLFVVHDVHIKPTCFKYDNKIHIKKVTEKHTGLESYVLLILELYCRWLNRIKPYKLYALYTH